MKFLYSLLAATLLAGPVRAQAPAPARTIALGAHEAMCGTIQLANRQTVLLVANLDDNTVQAQALAADGHTAWQARLRHRQQVIHADLDFTRLLADLGSKGAQQTQAKEALETAAQLTPMRLYSCNNQVFAMEKLTQNAYDRLSKEQARQLKPGQAWLQRIDEQGQVKEAAFAPRPEPETSKVDVVALAQFAEGEAYYEVVSETNRREKAEQFFLDRYDLSGKFTRQPLTLPPTPAAFGSWSGYMYWNSEWNCLGHTPGATYLYRRLLATDAKQKPGRQPVAYQILTFDNAGTTTGGFTTALGLSPGTGVTYSGPLDTQDEQTHLVHTATDGKIVYDSWDVATGGFGNFALDYATGDVLIYGEYHQEELPSIAFSSDATGFFLRRYSPQGQVKQQVQYAYSKAMQKANGGEFVTRLLRYTAFNLDPLTGQVAYSFRQAGRVSAGDLFTLTFDKDLGNPSYTFDKASVQELYKHPHPEVIYPGPAWLATSRSRQHARRSYAHAAATDAPAYVALEQLYKQAAVTPESTYELYLAATGPGKALVVERPQLVGGTLRVYLF